MDLEETEKHISILYVGFLSNAVLLIHSLLFDFLSITSSVVRRKVLFEKEMYYWEIPLVTYRGVKTEKIFTSWSNQVSLEEN